MKLSKYIGARKIKSLLAVLLSFLTWQIFRCFLPWIEVHPIFAYIYAIIEMREVPEKTISFGILRIKATFIGLIIGLIFLTISIKMCSKVNISTIRIIIELILILIASLLALCISDLAGCKNFCGIAAIITIICLVSLSETDRYLYAFTRVLQTIIGVFSATIINTFVCPPHRQNDIQS